MIYTLLWVAVAAQLALAAAVGADHLRRRVARWAWNHPRLEQARLTPVAPAKPPAVDDRPGTDQASYDTCMAILRATDRRTEDTP